MNYHDYLFPTLLFMLVSFHILLAYFSSITVLLLYAKLTSGMLLNTGTVLYYDCSVSKIAHCNIYLSHCTNCILLFPSVISL